MRYLECPYCDADCGDYFDDQHETEVNYEYECQDCGKNFIFTIEYYPSFSGYKTDCLNGGDHKYKPICGVPIEFFKNKLECEDCGKRITKEPEK